MGKFRSRALKHEMFDQFARMGTALSSSARLELIDLLAQCERTVDELATETEMSVANTSQHLQTLKHERLVRRRKDGTRAYYSLAAPEVYRAWQAIRALGESRLPEVDDIKARYLDDRDQLDFLSPAELERQLGRDDITILDVRPADEYMAGHIPGAHSLPIDEFQDEPEDILFNKDIIVYCRGPYCTFSDDAIRRLQEYGHDAQRLTTGFADWLIEERPIE